MSSNMMLEAPKPDARFPEQNKTHMCRAYYMDYHRCKNLKGQDYEPCEFFKKVYSSICPKFWTEKWDTWIEEGRFPGHLDR